MSHYGHTAATFTPALVFSGTVRWPVSVDGKEGRRFSLGTGPSVTASAFLPLPLGVRVGDANAQVEVAIVVGWRVVARRCIRATRARYSPSARRRLTSTVSPADQPGAYGDLRRLPNAEGGDAGRGDGLATVRLTLPGRVRVHRPRSSGVLSDGLSSSSAASAAPASVHPSRLCGIGASSG